MIVQDPDEERVAIAIVNQWRDGGWDKATANERYDGILEARAAIAAMRGDAQALREPVRFIDARLEDLAEANALYGKDQRLGAPDKIARNDREISWLKDLRSLILTASSTPSTERGTP